MATDLEEFRDSFNIETAGGVAEGEVMDYLVSGLELYNAGGSQAFELDVTTLDRVATGPERRALVLCAVKLYIRKKLLQASDLSIVESNAAGRTDLRTIAKEYAARLKEIDAELAKFVGANTAHDVISEIALQELGETLRVIDWGTFEG